jgi:aspartyl-tRNA(Asn)/glutamyl-tRNA(Gln) amidotransferase subunit A
VARLREQGAVFLGKTTTPEYGWKGVTDSPATGISRNPWDPSKTCGGSSGGAAIAAAAGFGVLHQGGDGGGSIRIPAALCGVYGIKPSYGRVPRHPHGTGVVGQITHTGPITRTVADAALMLTVLARPDARDWLALPFDDRDYRDRLDAGVRGVRIAYSPDLGYAEVDPEVAAICAEAVKVFATLGATVDAATPKIENPAWAFDVGYSIGFAQMLRAIPAEKRALMDPGLIELAERGKTRTMDEFYDAWARRDAMAKAINVFMEDWDLLVTPQLPIAAFDVGTPMPKGMSSAFDWLPFTYPFNMSHHPAGTVPCGFTRAGLPVALQIVGRMHDDVRVLQASRAFETARPFRIPEL